MPSYETLDNIADAYNPVLFALSLIYAVFYFRRGDRLAGLKGILGLFICYFILWLDNQLRIWPQFALDYSTHTAVAFAFTYFLLHKRDKNNSFSICLAVSLLAYFALMLYQQYHTLLDILSTLLIITPLTLGFYKLADKITNAGKAEMNG